jgi:hypothetical protein
MASPKLVYLLAIALSSVSANYIDQTTPPTVINDVLITTLPSILSPSSAEPSSTSTSTTWVTPTSIATVSEKPIESVEVSNELSPLNQGQTVAANTTSEDNRPDSALKVKLLLFTRKHPTIGVPLIPGNLSTVNSLVYYDAGQPTRFIIHSSFDGPEASTWMKDMKNRFLSIESSNIILVDWSRSASASMTDLRLTNVRMVGVEIARIIDDLAAVHGTKAKDVHLIAHSFGTFAADVVGRQIKGLGRISALDPGGPNFDALPIDSRVDKSDALFVDVIHTDAGNTSVTSLYGRGSQLALGHVDFFPNGGSDQPGCSFQRFEDLITRPIGEGIRRFVACHHYRAIDYYLESIMPASNLCVQLAFQCDNYTNFLEGRCSKCNDREPGYACAQMGFRSNLAMETLKLDDQPKKLFLATNRRKPFCLYHYSIEVKIADKPEQVRGGVLLLRITGEYGQMETRISGGMNGFRSDNITGIVTTHHIDIGAVKSLSLAWLPAPTLNLFADPTLHIEFVRITPLSVGDGNTRFAMQRTLCPADNNGSVSPFYRETFFTATESAKC